MDLAVLSGKAITMKALALNAGSSTLKAAVYDVEPGMALGAPPDPCWKDEVRWEPRRSAGTAEAMLRRLGRNLNVDVVGHRIVHGGGRFCIPERLTPEVKAVVASLATSAPLHNSAALEGVAVVERIAGDETPQVGVFDTGFHAGLSLAAQAYAGPRAWLDRGLRRFGFHGINHEFAAHRAANVLRRPLDELRLIICHLGSGCSVAAVRGGRSVDTTMGFTPLEGLVMGTRSGSLDPGLLLHLLREPGASVDALDAVLNHRSGLRGLSGISGDLRDVLTARAHGDGGAGLAFDVYIHRLRFHIGAMLPALGGLDAIVFTGGAGERSAPVRAAALAPFAFLGVELDPEQNEEGRGDIDVATESSVVRVLVIRAREEWAIARAAARVVEDDSSRCAAA
jgi:acetate kinase